VSTLLIVGAGPRLGGAIARRFGAAGFDVALLSDDEASVAALGESLQGEGITTGWAVADTRDDAAVRAAIARFANHTGGIDVALHNVSVWREASVLELTTEDVLADVHAGAASLFTIAQAVAPAMIAAGGGTILATGSAAADDPGPDAPTLGVQKAALRAVIRALALELGPHGVHCATVTINGVLGTPGFDPADIADLYHELATEPRDAWRTVVPFNGAPA
jgi:NAD(P)-dependent dehydrogenase (short-subunit alcohol dehydrogenase family)